MIFGCAPASSGCSTSLILPSRCFSVPFLMSDGRSFHLMSCRIWERRLCNCTHVASTGSLTHSPVLGSLSPAMSRSFLTIEGCNDSKPSGSSSSRRHAGTDSPLAPGGTSPPDAVSASSYILLARTPMLLRRPTKLSATVRQRSPALCPTWATRMASLACFSIAWKPSLTRLSAACLACVAVLITLSLRARCASMSGACLASTAARRLASASASCRSASTD